MVTKKFVMSENVAPAFYEMWSTRKPYICLSGGRSSTKSSVLSLKFISQMMQKQNTGMEIVCFRQVGNTLLTSVYAQMLWAIDMMGVTEEWKMTKVPLQLQYKPTGSKIYFLGLDDEMKVKSFKASPGKYVGAIFFEEAAELKGFAQIDTVADTFIREETPTGMPVQVYMAWNPPRSAQNWINLWTEEKKMDPDYLVVHTTYRDVISMGFISQQFVDKVEKTKKNDYNYFLWQYEGLSVGMGAEIYNYNSINIVNEVEKDDKIVALFFSTDAGHANSAMVMGCYGRSRKGNIYLLGLYYYSPKNELVKRAPSDHSKFMFEFFQRMTRKWNLPIINNTIDSAEQSMVNQLYLDYKMQFRKVKKLDKVQMIEISQQPMGEGRFFILDDGSPEMAEAKEQFRLYAWQENKIDTDKPMPVKERDDIVDSFQYLCLANSRILDISYKTLAS